MQQIRPIIAVPVHKEVPTPMEIVSLRQLGKIMAAREILIISPHGVSTYNYKSLLPHARDLKVHPRQMASWTAYNQMMISPFLYQKLRRYSHMLLHEPDALVFSDQLDFWCAQPFDYLGSPWPKPDHSPTGFHFHPHINGGFSLSNISSMRRVTSSWKRWHSWRHVMGDIVAGLRGDRMKLKRGLIAAYPGGLLRGASRLYQTGWDKFFFEVVPPLCPEFRIPPPEVCVRFSWQFATRYCIRQTQGQLPFGLHAWARWDFGHLRPLMAEAGVDLSGFEK
jgi:hypothetical protein